LLICFGFHYYIYCCDAMPLHWYFYWYCYFRWFIYYWWLLFISRCFPPLLIVNIYAFIIYHFADIFIAIAMLAIFAAYHDTLWDIITFIFIYYHFFHFHLLLFIIDFIDIIIVSFIHIFISLLHLILYIFIDIYFHVCHFAAIFTLSIYYFLMPLITIYFSATHYAIRLSLFSPPRRYWCFRYWFRFLISFIARRHAHFFFPLLIFLFHLFID